MNQSKNRLVNIVRLSMKHGGLHMSSYGAVTSRKDFTQRQLLTCLVLRACLKTTYRGVIEFLETSESLREEMGMKDKLPHYSTLAKFSERSAVMEIVGMFLGKLGQESADRKTQAVVIDSTGLEPSAASAHFVSRSGKQRRKWIKLSVAVLCGSLLPVAAVLSWGPGNDLREARQLLTQSMAQIRPPTVLYADAGYDAEWVHSLCRQTYGIKRTVIKPARRAADGTCKGFYRSKMSEQYLKTHGYGKRWAVETYMSGLKRITGATLSARKSGSMFKEAAFKVLAYALHR